MIAVTVPPTASRTKLWQTNTAVLERDNGDGSISVSASPFYVGEPMRFRYGYQQNVDVDIVSVIMDWNQAAIQSRHRLQGLHETALATDAIEEDRFQIRQSLNELKALEYGWADGMQHPSRWGEGYGKVPSADGLDWLASQLARHYVSGLPEPHLYPTPEGGVQIEWHIGPFEVDLNVDLDAQSGEWGCTNVETHEDSERDLDLESANDWSWIVRELQQLWAQAT